MPETTAGPGEQNNFFSVNSDTINYANVDAVGFAMGELPIDGLLSIDLNLITSPNSPTNFDGQIGPTARR